VLILLFSLLFNCKLSAVDFFMTSQIQIKKCTALADFHRCVELQQRIWGESNLETEPCVTFVVANQTGGQVLGAFDGDKMIGFTMALVGVRNKVAYLHSHMTGVLTEYRDRKVGRSLKLFQREEALSRDIRLIEWTFDPLETRNAHFNLNRLGAIVRTYIPNFYGITSSPLHRGLPTDRLLAEWRLDSARVIAAINDLAPEPSEAPTAIHVPALVGAGFVYPELRRARPASGTETTPAPNTPVMPISGSAPPPPSLVAPASSRQAKSEAQSASASSSDASVSPTIAIQSKIRFEFQHWFSKNYAATSVRFTSTGADYLLHPWSDF
jgi:predicted GNAT superfamily acetyltransferase